MQLKRALDEAVLEYKNGAKAAARAALGRALKLSPEHPDALHMLANLDGEEGNLDSAERRVRGALAQRKDFPAYLATLSRILSARGETTAAIASLEKALQQAPNAAGLNELGVLLLNGNRPERAAEVLEQALMADPGNNTARINLGVALFACGEARRAAQQLAEARKRQPGNLAIAQRLGMAWQACGEHERAIEALRLALGADPASTALLTSLGVSLTAAGRFDDAMTYFDRALAIDEGCADAVAGKAELLEWQGDYTAGLQLLKPLIDTGIDEPAVLTVYARLLRRTGDARAGIRLLQPLAESGQMQGVQLRQLRFTLGDLCDQLGDFDAAFSWYQRAHEYRPNRFSPTAHRQYVEGMLERFSADAVANMQRSGLTTEQPIFIVGMPRSGTSLVEQILASHPRVFAAGERAEIGEIVQVLAAQVSPARSELAAHAQAYLDALGDEAAGALRITDKMPLNFLYLGWVAQLFPQARVIWCRRDARDTGLSCYCTNFIDPALAFCDDLREIGAYSISCNILMRHWQKVLGLHIAELEYETLVSQPEQSVRALLAALELDWHPGCLEFHRTKRIVKTSSHAQVREAFYTRAVGRWKHYARHLQPLLDSLEENA